ncbi:Uu.00g076130.m01.CDS01 [Anthostomella pinea]|uniref:Protein SDA1 n=1 Tax=Anthostomella pinea TaxID=933095 RepID=A0AAI8YP63_9PEZI|nr:Uu.00g076130.m01.CDS01 [Anthostomella pinea]
MRRKVTALEKVDADLAGLQYRIRKDPLAYEKEFLEVWSQYEAAHEKYLADPIGADANGLVTWREQIDMVAHVAELYPQITAGFPDDLREVLTRHHAVLEPNLREKIVSSLTLLRRKDVVDSTYIHTALFPILITTPSKTLRMLLYQKILSDIRNVNSKASNHRVNRTMQTVLFNLVSDPTSPKSIWACKLVRELWKRQVWKDSKSVEIMVRASLSDNEKTVSSAVAFFLSGDKEREEFVDEDSEEENIDMRKIKHQATINKKTNKKKAAMEKAAVRVKKQERKKTTAPHLLNFSALHLLQDPQGFSETLYEKHLANKRSKLALETKLLVLSLVTRLVGLHKLTVIPLYSWFIRHLTPRQQSVTSILASLAQATHNLVPPDVIEPLIQKIANEFVSEGSASEVCAAGINAIREICVRQPLSMNETLLQDLVEYRRSKDKGVSMAAKGLLSLYRDEGAEMLRKKDRGKTATMGLRSGDLKQQKFGEEQLGEIEGLELLARWKEEQKKRKRAEQGLPEPEAGEKIDDEDDGFNSDDWEVASADSSDSGDWIRVSDSEDEAVPDAKKRKVDPEEADEEGQETAGDEPMDFMKLATSQILTPADLAKLKELRLEAEVDKATGNRKRKQDMEARHLDEGLTAEQIEAPARLRKSTKEERVALAREGKGDRDEHKSTSAIRKSKKEAEGKSTTNKEKARKKNFLMTIGKAKSKQKRSLVDTRNALTNHTHGRFEYHIPACFDEKRLAIAYSRLQHDTKTADDPLGARLPRPAAGPVVFNDREEFAPFERRPDGPQTMLDCLHTDAPQLSLHIVSFADLAVMATYSFGRHGPDVPLQRLDRRARRPTRRRPAPARRNGRSARVSGFNSQEPYALANRLRSPLQALLFAVMYLRDTYVWHHGE